MNLADLVRSLAAYTRAWREQAARSLKEEGCTDLSYRPSSGMSSVGWLLAHQAAVYDFTLNVLIKGESPEKPDLFSKYTPGTGGDWADTPLEEIDAYYDSTERAFLAWSAEASTEELSRVLEGTEIPEYFRGMRIIDVIANAFVHLNHHNGHLSAIKGDWCMRE
ncbi:MAG: DinB family protein [Candidatus Thorarchaeota archaeon]|nr:MAG: DinB family protein [Candidatus Thorarchaeota archaeon]